MKFQFKKMKTEDKALIIVILLLLVVFIGLFVGEQYIIKHNKRHEVKYIEENEVVTPTVQKALGYNYVKVQNWQALFDKIQNDDKSYELRDVIEEAIETNTTIKEWSLENVNYNANETEIYLLSKRDNNLKIVIDNANQVTSFVLDDSEKIISNIEVTY